MGEVCESSSRTEPNIYISEIQILLIRRDKATLLLYCELTKRVSFEAILRSQKKRKIAIFIICPKFYGVYMQDQFGRTLDSSSEISVKKLICPRFD